MSDSIQTRLLSLSPALFLPLFLPYLKDPRPAQHIFGGAGSGKSVFATQRIVSDLMEGQRNYLCLRKVANTLKDSVMAEIRATIAKWKLGDYFAVNLSDKTITCLATDCQAFCRGIEDPERIKGIRPINGTLTDVWYEEATEFSQDEVEDIGLRLRGEAAVPKRELFTYNPIKYGHWIHREVHRSGAVQVIDEEDLLVLRSTYRDNTFLTADDIKRYEKKRRSKYHADVYLDGLWGNLAGVILTDWEVADLSGKQFDHVRHGCDFGFHPDPAAYVKVAIEGNTLFILAEEGGKKLHNDELARRISPLVGEDSVWCDSAEPKSISEMRSCGVHARGVKKGPDSVRYGAQWMQRMHIVIDKRCVNTKSEIEQWQWEKDKHGDELPQPVGINDHWISAIRYACERDMKRKAMPSLVTTSEPEAKAA